MEKHIDPDEENLSKQWKLMTTIVMLIISDCGLRFSRVTQKKKKKPVFVFNQWIII